MLGCRVKPAIVDRDLKPVNALARIRCIVRSWGGDVVLVSREEFSLRFTGTRLRARRGYHGAPFRDWLGIHRPSATIFSTVEDVHPESMIHEAGHLFAIENDDVDESYEYSWLGWEIAFARHISCYRQWSRQNASYGLGDEFDGEPWAGLTSRQRQRVAAERVAYARHIGIVSRDGVPLKNGCVRGAEIEPMTRTEP